MESAERHRVLVVEDDPDTLNSICDLLATVPSCSCQQATSFAEGRALALQGGWSIVIADERLPDGRGVAILSELKRAHPRATRVLMSAHRDFRALIQGVNDCDIDFYLEKPWDPSELQRWVARRLGERAPRPEPGLGRIPPARSHARP